MGHRRLTQSGSAFLDVVRFGAACVVFVNHLAYLVPAAGRLVHFSHIAVCIFFVLSGFIIRMLVRSRETTMRLFLIDRASRIYSVVLPALVLSFVCWGITMVVHPNDPRVGLEVTPHVPLQIATNLTFTAELWGYERLPNFDSPFWSLSFECIYYVLFALMYFRWQSLWGKALFVLLLLVSGPSIVLLFPVWLLGCLLYDVYVWLEGKWYDWMLTSGLLVSVLGFALLERHRLAYVLTVTDEDHRLGMMQRSLPPWAMLRFADSTGTVPWLNRASFSYWIAGLIASILMLWGLVMADRFYPAIGAGLAKKIRWVAEGTFALYLFHLPLIMLSYSMFGDNPRLTAPLGILIGILCIVASPWCDRLKIRLRVLLQQYFPAMARAH